MSIQAAYGHGTHNDFVLVYDPAEEISISSAETARICNRETGIGADGLIRIVKRGDSGSQKWFMDYRNADGSLAEMCGNGIRVMAKYLVERGHQAEGIFPIDTRDGVKHLRVPADGDITVNMGQVVDEGDEITAGTESGLWKGFHISTGNPHAVVFVEDLEQVGSLKHPPTVRPKELYPEGVNVEFVQFAGDHVVKMRVHERGSGETKSCGTGVVAVAMAATKYHRESLPTKWEVNPPGGRLYVEIDGHSNAILTGPAVIIKDVEIEEFLER
jgi:diaminopimelate epimerase